MPTSLITRVEEERGSVYELHGKLEDCYHPQNYKLLTLSTLWTGAKNPKLPHTKLRLLLSPESLANLRNLLGEAQ